MPLRTAGVLVDLGVPENICVMTIHSVPASGRTGVRVTVERDARIVAEVQCQRVRTTRH